MRAAAEVPGGRAGSTARMRGRAGSTRVVGAALLTLGLVTGLALAGCTSGGGPVDAAGIIAVGSESEAGAGPESGAGTGAGTGAESEDLTLSGIPADDAAAIRRTIEQLNDTAGGPAAQQRSVLERLVARSDASSQRACPDARATLSFEPSFRDLRHATDADDDSTDSAPRRYLLPTFIVIHHDTRIVGTDMATLRLFVSDGMARLAAMCVA